LGVQPLTVPKRLVKLSQGKEKKVSNSPEDPTGLVPATKGASERWSRGLPLREPQAEVFGKIQTIRTMFIIKQLFI
jgi:hypothetical protein